MTMGKTCGEIDVQVPVARCYSFVKDSVQNPKFLSAYKDLHSGREYSGRIAEEAENRRLVIEESGMDSVTRIRHKGWTIIYDFEAVSETKTKIGISVEYGTFLALMGATTTKLQSVNEVLARVAALLALEYA
jgi:hypothetical protein